MIERTESAREEQLRHWLEDIGESSELEAEADRINKRFGPVSVSTHPLTDAEIDAWITRHSPQYKGGAE